MDLKDCVELTAELQLATMHKTVLFIREQGKTCLIMYNQVGTFLGISYEETANLWYFIPRGMRVVVSEGEIVSYNPS